MTDRAQERTALALFLESVRLMGSTSLVVQRDDPADFPDFVLLNRATGQEVWVEIVEAVESGELIAAERQAQRRYDAAAREYRARGEEVVLRVSRHGVEDVTPSPGFGVTGVIVPGPPRKISPSGWIARALNRKGRAGRYGDTERARTTLVIDCSREVFVDIQDAGTSVPTWKGARSASRRSGPSRGTGRHPTVSFSPHDEMSVMTDRESLPNYAVHRTGCA